VCPPRAATNGNRPAMTQATRTRRRRDSSPGSSSSSSRSRSHSDHRGRHGGASGGGDRRRSSREDRRSRHEGDADPPQGPAPEAGDAGATANGTGGSSPTTEGTPSRTHKVSKEKIAGLLGKYDGKTCLDTFLNKFDKCIDYENGTKWTSNSICPHL